MRLHFVLFGIATAIVLSGCAAGKRVDYRVTTEFVAPTVKGTTVSVGAQDVRPYVLDGSKQTNFVGLSRSMAGIPYGVVTTSGDPLADEIGALIAGALRKNGATVMEVKIPVGTPAVGRVALFKATNSTRNYLLEIREWKTDTYSNTTLSYDISLNVLDNLGAVLATKNIKGQDKLGSRPDRMTLATAISSIFGGLLNEPEIVSAGGAIDASTQPLATSSVAPSQPAPAKASGCSVDQVLEMKKVGLSEDRIRMACK